MVVVRTERDSKDSDITENKMPRGLYIDKVLRQVLTDSDSEGECSPSDDDVQSSRESDFRESSGA